LWFSFDATKCGLKINSGSMAVSDNGAGNHALFLIGRAGNAPEGVENLSEREKLLKSGKNLPEI